MKKQLFLLSSLLIIAFNGATAQKNSLLVAGTINISSAKEPSSMTNSEYKSTNFGFNPQIGYQFDDNFTAGIYLGIQSSKQTTTNSDYKRTLTGFAGGPFIRYTKKLSDIFSVYGELIGEFGSSKEKINNPPFDQEESKISVFAAGIIPSVFVNLKNNFGLNFSFGGLVYQQSKPEDGETSSVFGLTFGQVASIGISKNFTLKKKK